MAKFHTMISPKIRKPLLTEDWTVVVLAFLILFAFLAGLKLPTPVFEWSNSAEFFQKILNFGNIEKIFLHFVLILLITALASYILKKSLKKYLFVTLIVFVLTIAAMLMAGNTAMKNLNLEAVIFSLLTGLLISNTFNLPDWFQESLSAEFFVKIGLILLGSNIIFGDILKAGALGLIQALVVVISVWYFSFWLSKKFKIENETGLMLSSAVSICGVSAAIATSGAIKGDSKKLSYVISLVLIIAIPMMIFMPYAASFLGLSQAVTGAWLGGTIDTTGAVVAAGTLVGEEAVKIASVVKFSQNVLLGIAAFLISIYWTYLNSTPDKEMKPSAALIWQRFPKFVLGFVAASILFSFFVPAENVEAVKGSIKSVQNLWFALAFTSIGLETKFSDLLNPENKKPLYVFLLAQTFNIAVTLAVALLLFG